MALIKIGWITALGLIYIALWAGVSIPSIGTPITPGIYSNWLPFELIVAFGVAFALGYFGRAEEDTP